LSSIGGTSLAEARELYNTLTECMRLLDLVEQKAQSSNVSMTRLLTVTNSLLLALDRAGYGGGYEDTLSKIRFVIMMLQRLQTVALLTNIALSSGPLGAALAVIGIGVTVSGLVDTAGMII